MTNQGMPDSWTARLADLLLRIPVDPGDAALESLSDTMTTGNPATDKTRDEIMRLLSQLDLQTRQDRSPRVPPPSLPDWPGAGTLDVPPFHPTGLAGTSIVSVCRHDADMLAASLPSWLDLPVDEILLVDWSPALDLDTTLASQGLSDPRLRIVRIDGADLSPSQAFNVGFRLARHQRTLALAAAVRLKRDYLASTPLTAGDVRVDPGPADGSSFVLDINRRDLAQVGGFNEYLASADYCVDDLAARLATLGLRSVPISAERIVRPSAPPPLKLGADSLQDTLRHSPDFAALQNRFLSAVLPDWSGTRTRSFGRASPADQRLTLHALTPPPIEPPAAMRAEAERHALVDLVARHVGGNPIALDPDRFDMVLACPANDVGALDVAIAAGPSFSLVKSRKVWLLVQLAADALPHEGSEAQTAFKLLEELAARHELTLVLTLPPSSASAEPALQLAHPIVSPDPDLTIGFWPLPLRDLLTGAAAAPMLPHSTLVFNAQTVADLSAVSKTGPTILSRRPKLFIDAQHGLGNRLRAMASAGAIAAATGRELVIIWQSDAHCRSHFEDLFEPSGSVLNQGFHTECAQLGINLINYMEVEPGSAKNAPVDVGAIRDIYLRSAYPFVSPFSTWDSENAWLHRLRPNPVVLDLAASVRNENALAMHIRMEGGFADEHLPYESPGNWTEAAHLEIDHWRKRSHFSYFQTRLDQLIAQGHADTVFLASDTPSVYDAFTTRYGSRVASLRRDVTDRSTKALVHALADALLLSRASRLLGSQWSSFTELAFRLARKPIDVELSGRDF